MYLFEEVNEWKEFKCEICKRSFKNWEGISKHVQQLYDHNPTGIHPHLDDYKRRYFPPGYINGVPPNNKCIYVLCDPELPGNFRYTINLLGEDIELIFNFSPLYVGYGNMGGKDGRYRINSGKDCNKDLRNRISELKDLNIRIIQYIIKENLTIQQGKEGEKILIPLIGRFNHPNPDGELSKKSRDQMSESRSGNKNRCDTWKLTRRDDGYIVNTNDLRKTCEELGLDIKCIHQIAAGKQKSHRSWYAENLTKRKAVGGNY